MKTKTVIAACLLCAFAASPGFAEEDSRKADARYFNDKAVEYIKLDNLDAALTCLQKAIEIDPDSSSAHANIGLVYRKQGENDHSLEHLRKAIELNPQLREAYSTIVAVYNEKGDYRTAAEYSQKALAIEVDTARSEYNLGFSCLLEGNKAGALEQYAKLKEAGKTEYAQRLLEKIHRLWPQEQVNVANSTF
jgi:tetratricopeptide (TPR) repeat protein